MIVALSAALPAIGAAASSLHVDEVRITGLTSLPPASVARAAGLSGGERLLFTRLSEVERRVERLPEVRRAHVSRRLPGTVVVSVQERVPLLRLEGHPELAADEDGRIVPVLAVVILPVLTGWSGTPEPGGPVDEISASVLEAYVSFPEELRQQVSSVVAGRRVELVLTDATHVVMGRPDDLRTKAVVALAVLRDARSRMQQIEYIDVRAPGTPVARERELAPEDDG